MRYTWCKSKTPTSTLSSGWEPLANAKARSWRMLTLEEVLALVAWVQRHNHRAYLAHRKRRCKVNASTICRKGALYAQAFFVVAGLDLCVPARAIGARAGHQEAQHPRDHGR